LFPKVCRSTSGVVLIIFLRLQDLGPLRDG
jgi:hypothetical protein